VFNKLVEATVVLDSGSTLINYDIMVVGVDFPRDILGIDRLTTFFIYELESRIPKTPNSDHFLVYQIEPSSCLVRAAAFKTFLRSKVDTSPRNNLEIFFCEMLSACIVECNMLSRSLTPTSTMQQGTDVLLYTPGSPK